MSELATAPAPAPVTRIRGVRIVPCYSIQIPGWQQILVFSLVLTIVGLFIVFPILGVLGGYRRNRVITQLHRDVPAEMRKFVGAEPTYIDYDIHSTNSDGNELSASGLAYADGRLFAMSSGVIAEIPWSMIRSWTWKIAGLKTYSLGGNQGERIATNDLNYRNLVTASRASGFFISVRDVDRPEWQVQSMNETLLKRWEEIFNQMRSGELKIR